MKNAGILTFHSGNNFGAVLQSYALCETLKKYGINAEIINYRYIKNIKMNNNQKIYSHSTYELLKCRINFAIFRKKHLSLSSPLDKLNEENIPRYNYYIVGSDQVWNPLYSDDVFFLPFSLGDAIKIAYAPSIGVEISNNSLNKKKFEKFIPTFDYLSIREHKYENFIQQYTQKKVHTVLDPTLLLNANDYYKLLPKKTKKDKFILYYFFDYNPIALHFAKKLAKINGYKIIYYSCTYNQNKLYCNNESFFYKSPRDFLWYVKNAETIITHSFHATVFSVLFKKPFYVFKHNDTGSRVESLCNMLGLKDRIIDGLPKLRDVNLDIDYKSVHIKLDKERKKSELYLKEALGINNNI